MTWFFLFVCATLGAFIMVRKTEVKRKLIMSAVLGVIATAFFWLVYQAMGMLLPVIVSVGVLVALVWLFSLLDRKPAAK